MIPRAIPSLKGHKALVVGIANEHSIGVWPFWPIPVQP